MDTISSSPPGSQRVSIITDTSTSMSSAHAQRRQGVKRLAEGRYAERDAGLAALRQASKDHVDDFDYDGGASVIGDMEDPDLSHLTVEERRIIEGVMMRQKQEEDREHEIMR